MPTPAEKTETLMEFGYTHEERKDRDGYYPIESNSNGVLWHDTLEEAEKAMRNDLRWRPETFIIARPKPEAGKRYACVS